MQRPRVGSQPGDVAHLAHRTEPAIRHLHNEPRRQRMGIRKPFRRPSLHGGRGLCSTEQGLPFVGGPAQEGALHGRRDAFTVIGADRIVAQGPGGGPPIRVQVGIEIRELLQQPFQPQGFKHAPGMGHHTAGNHIEATAIRAGVGAVEGIEQPCQVPVIEIHGKTFPAAPFNLQLPGGLVAVGIVLDAFAVVGQALQQRGGQRHLDPVSAVVRSGPEGKQHGHGPECGAIGGRQRERSERRADPHQPAVQSHVGKLAGRSGDDRLPGRQVAASCVPGSKSRKGKTDQVGVRLAQRLPVESEPCHDSRAEILDEHIRPAHQRKQDIPVLPGLEIEFHRRLAPDEHPGSRGPVHRTARRIDTDDLGAHVGKHHPHQGAGKIVSKVQDPDVVEGSA